MDSEMDVYKHPNILSQIINWKKQLMYIENTLVFVDYETKFDDKTREILLI
jgi:hypothetical protein